MSGGYATISTFDVTRLHGKAHAEAVRLGLPTPRPQDETGNDYDVADGDERAWVVDTNGALSLNADGGKRTWCWNGKAWKKA